MIHTDVRDGVAILTIDQADRSMNVLGADFVTHFGQAFETVCAQDEVRGIVITSAKDSFVAGADLTQMADFVKPGVSPRDAADMIAVYGTLFRRIETCGKPVVAAAPGTALGGGLELMLACRFRIAADNPSARFGLPEVGLGLLPGAGGTQRLPRMIGIAKALPIMLEGTPMTAQAACAAGILDAVVPAGQLLQAAVDAIDGGRVDPVAPWDVKGFRLPGGGAYERGNDMGFMMGNAGVHARTHGNYPAPQAILSCVYEGTRVPIDTGLRIEQKYFARLVQGSVAQNMIRTLFFARQDADKLVRRPGGVPASAVKRLGILGAGFMGAGIAQASAQAGIDVVMVDRDEATARKSLDGILAALDKNVAKGRLSQRARDEASAHLSAGADYSAFGDCDMVIEAVIEDFGIKEVVTRAAEAAMRPDAIFASNTSALPINDLARVSTRPDHFIGLHFFSPVLRMALVEVIVGEATSDATLARSLDYIRQIRKTPIVVNDGYGFYTTRCVDAYVREGIRLFIDGVDPVLIENAGVALGMPVGPLALGDEVGLDVLHHIAHFFRGKESGDWADDRHEKITPLLDQLIADKRFGRKTGSGFYAYPKDAPKHLDLDDLGRRADRAAVQPARDVVSERLLYAQLVEAARCWADGVATDAREIDLGAVLGWAFPAYLGGPATAIDQIGVAAFIARSDDLSASLGVRFTPPEPLREAARRGMRMHGGA